MYKQQSFQNQILFKKILSDEMLRGGGGETGSLTEI